jgi:hypothetical protein
LEVAVLVVLFVAVSYVASRVVLKERKDQ